MHEEDIDVAEFQQLLMARRELLLAVEETGRDAAKVVELDQTKVGRLSRMDALQGQAMSQEAQRRRTQELSKIQSALQRIGQGEYGYCLKCGEFIGLGRLRIDPAAPFCVTCAD